jgi:hypothetical protein
MGLGVKVQIRRARNGQFSVLPVWGRRSSPFDGLGDWRRAPRTPHPPGATSSGRGPFSRFAHGLAVLSDTQARGD